MEQGIIDVLEAGISIFSEEGRLLSFSGERGKERVDRETTPHTGGFVSAAVPAAAARRTR
jgi:hypothetical protein